ncbi:MAG: PQQ-binding-like beta-propeller repeat protein [Kiritimatiellae bacterium]|nr:PQQ-binding-like beta-propeller repeat protein [Kiritimatiellia bacterium]
MKLAGFIFAFVGVAMNLMAVDWPMWRYDARHSAVPPEKLPDKLHLQWVRELPTPIPAWPLQSSDQGDKLQFDFSYEPVAMGKMLFVPSMRDDSLRAYDAETGEEKWCFYADGPFRLAPLAWKDRIYAGSDDGYLYCLDAKKGTLLWKFQGAPSDKKVWGNKRLISMWPVRGAPVAQDGVLYFSAGIWPFMGIFIYAVEMNTGQAIWCNSSSGSVYTNQPHKTPSFAGIAPQGYMTIAPSMLLVTGGRSMPGAYDLKSGRLLYLDLANRTFGKRQGGYGVAVQKDWYFNGGIMYRISNGVPVTRVSANILIGDNTAIGVDSVTRKLTAWTTRPEEQKLKISDIKNKLKFWNKYTLPKLWEAGPLGVSNVLICAGNRLYGYGQANTIMAIDLPKDNQPAHVSWEGKVEGRIWNMLAANGRLFVVTMEGRLYCFAGPELAEPVRYSLNKPDEPVVSDWNQKAENILNQAGIRDGICCIWGAGTGNLAESLLRKSNLKLVIIDPDANKVASLRKRFDAMGLYGARVAIHAGDPMTFPLPPYFASLIVSEDWSRMGIDKGPQFLKRLFYPLRPYGGVACLPPEYQNKLQTWIMEAKLENAEIKQNGDFTMLVRAGALPGSADWTHQYADIGNTVCSKDSIVEAPLGLLWFDGGPSNEKVLPRHGHGPRPLVLDGRLFIEGTNTLSARDVYTGRELWCRELSWIGKSFDNTQHQAGANSLGSNYAVTRDGVYVAYGRVGLRLDPATGEKLAEFRLPRMNGIEGDPSWGYIGIWEDLLVATAEPLISGTNKVGGINWNGTASRALVVMDRMTGKPVWTRESVFGFRHNAIAAGDGKLFCIDRLAESVLAKSNRKPSNPDAKPVLQAFNIRTGQVLWQTQINVFGRWLGYSEKYDVLIQSGRPSSDMLKDEPKDRIIAYRGKNGKVLWEKTKMRYLGPLVLHDNQIIPSAPSGGITSNRSSSAMMDLLTGNHVTRKHPLTGKDIPWTYARAYGCGAALAGEKILTFRSGSAAYCDLIRGGGTTSLGGFKAGCTENLIPANGVLNAPDYTRTCSCAYQNQVSLALITMPDVEEWTSNTLTPSIGIIKRVGINLGAPGDRSANNGTLWLDFPSVGGPSPVIPVTIVPAKPEWFCIHSSLINDDGQDNRWIVASGARGITSIGLTLIPENKAGKELIYTVRLYFSEPDMVAAHQRVFAVWIQGQEMLPRVDIVKEAEGIRHALVKEFKGIKVSNQLKVELRPLTSTRFPPLLCGVEVSLEE